jgi:hypothetical protein
MLLGGRLTWYIRDLLRTRRRIRSRSWSQEKGFHSSAYTISTLIMFTIKAVWIIDHSDPFFAFIALAALAVSHDSHVHI